MGWLAAGPAILAAVAAVWIPGLLVLVPMRMGPVARAALMGPISILLIGLTGILAAAVGVPFSFWQPVLLGVVGGALLWTVRNRIPALPCRDGGFGALAASWLASAVTMAVVAFARVPSPALPSQTYDNVFHLSAIASILQHGDASSLTLRTLIETGADIAFYPAGWHSVVAIVAQVTGASIPVAANASWIAVAGAIWLPGVAWLAQALLPGRRPRTVALVALPVGAAFGAFPYALLAWGTLYPTILATALLPAAVAVPVLGWRALRGARAGRRGPVLAMTLTGTIAAAVAVAFGQPRVLVSWGLLIALPAGIAATAWMRLEWRRGGAARRRLRNVLIAAGIAVVIVLAAGSWYLVFRLGLFERPLDDRLGGPQAQAMQPLWVGAWQVLSQSWLVGAGSTALPPTLLLAAVVVIGSIAAWRSGRWRWIVFAYAIVALLYVLAAGSDDIATKLATALWYKDKYRLSSVLPVLGVPLATLGVLVVARWFQHGRSRRTVAVVIAWAVAASAALGMMLGGASGAIAAVFRLPERAAQAEVVSHAQIEFFARLHDEVPEDQLVLGDPWDGSAWTLVFGDREPVFPHVNGQWDPDRVTLAWFLQDIDTDPAVCDALDRLRVRYVIHNPHAFGGGDPAGNHFPGPHAAVDAGLFTEVMTDGDSTLYRIDQCGPLAESGHP